MSLECPLSSRRFRNWSIFLSGWIASEWTKTTTLRVERAGWQQSASTAILSPFRDFLLDPETRDRNPFWIGEKELHYRLTTRCLMLWQTLRRNLCGLPKWRDKARGDWSLWHQPLSFSRIAIRLPLFGTPSGAKLKPWERDRRGVSIPQESLSTLVEVMSILGIVSETVGMIDLLQLVPYVSLDSPSSRVARVS